METDGPAATTGRYEPIRQERSTADQVEEVVIECTKGSDEERLTFPQVVMKLMAAGVERYHTDLQRAEKTYYLPDGRSLVVPAAPLRRAPARAFSAAGVATAVRTIQAQKLTYEAFCQEISPPRAASAISSPLPGAARSITDGAAKAMSSPSPQRGSEAGRHAAPPPPALRPAPLPRRAP